ncbi:MAG: DDE-type integrase/transposase/recombinase [Planctomycetes bacterium]|nr:DDE-type integrase/transposase/recombinase [Planctomycetota bacterium]
MIEQTVEDLTPLVGTYPACRALGVAPATIYRRRCPSEPGPKKPRPKPARALSAEERQKVLDTLHSERFVDCSPDQVWATLLDVDQLYLASVRTMYRLLAEQGESRERRDQLVHPPYAKPQLLATRPNELWSWDITKLLGPAKWTYFYLYVILDVFSRYVVGWTIQHRESAGCVFRRSGPPIPNEVRPLFRGEVGRRFRSMWAADSGACGPPPSERSDAGVEVRPEPSRRACLGWPSCVA